MTTVLAEPCTIPSIYSSPNTRAAARHLKAQQARRVKFAQHVRETIIDDPTAPIIMGGGAGGSASNSSTGATNSNVAATGANGAGVVSGAPETNGGADVSAEGSARGNGAVARPSSASGYVASLLAALSSYLRRLLASLGVVSPLSGRNGPGMSSKSRVGRGGRSGSKGGGASSSIGRKALFAVGLGLFLFIAMRLVLNSGSGSGVFGSLFASSAAAKGVAKRRAIGAAAGKKVPLKLKL